MPLMKLKRQNKSSGSIEPLRWLFTAHFEDGTAIVQDQADKCYTRDDGTGSTFTDVLAEDGLVAFELRHATDNQSVVVDLITGAFMVNGTPVHLHNQFFEPEKYKLELVYFRETRVEQTITTSGETLSQRHFVNRYFIGWKTQVHGKDKQITLAVG